MSLDFENPILELEGRIAELRKLNADPGVKFDAEIAQLEKELKTVKERIYSGLTPWQRVQIARHKDRPLFRNYVSLMLSDFVELHGDRCFGDDRALVGGFATIEDKRVMLLGFDKGRTVEEKVLNNFGMAHPEGYRKALRLMRLAAKYRIPIVCLIDTPAAYPGAAAEERGQAEAIARNITEMSAIEVPIVAAVTGEGGSGGALGIAVADFVIMLSNSIYSVIPPEGCAAILMRDAAKAPEAAEALKLTADSLLELGVIDEIVEESIGGAHRDYEGTARMLKKSLLKAIVSLERNSPRSLLAKRYEKYSKLGRSET